MVSAGVYGGSGVVSGGVVGMLMVVVVCEVVWAFHAKGP